VVSIRESFWHLARCRRRHGCTDIIITPTYSAVRPCRLLKKMSNGVAEMSGIVTYRGQTVLSPAWTTDWMTPEGRDCAPTVSRATGSVRDEGLRPARQHQVHQAAPSLTLKYARCTSAQHRTLSQFGSTAWRCTVVHSAANPSTISVQSPISMILIQCIHTCDVRRETTDAVSATFIVPPARTGSSKRRSPDLRADVNVQHVLLAYSISVVSMTISTTANCAVASALSTAACFYITTTLRAGMTL
jgi:ring-1,2-phenylacetyl-CoA epoxidase subunit PaaD